MADGIVALDDAGRVRLTTSCRDTDPIPKVDQAGAVVDTDDGPIQVMHNGVRVVEGCYYGPWMTEIIRDLRGHHEPQEEAVFHVLVERLGDTAAPVIVELGAFWAYYSLWFLERWPDGRAILVEPDPAYLAVGRRNFELNRRTGHFVAAAVGEIGIDAIDFACESDGDVRLVPVVSLASLVEQFALERIDLLLVDVQGAETGLLRGALPLLAERVRFLVLSTHHHVISGDPLTHQRCLDLVRRAGGRIVAEHTVAESFSGDGLIAASFDGRDADLTVAVTHARASQSLFGDGLGQLDAFARAAAEAEAGRAASAARVAELEGDLEAIASTATWRLRTRLLGIPVVRRAMARVGSLARREPRP